MDIHPSSISMALAITPSPAWLFGLMLLSALAGGYLARLVHVPRVVGFLLAGVLLRVGIYGLFVSEGDEAAARACDAAAEPLDAIKDLALGLILFVIGGVFERSRLVATGRRILRISVFDVCVSGGVVFVGCLAATLIVQRACAVQENIALALLLATAAVATAPAATLFVLNEYEAKGPITDTILGVTALNNILCIVLFHTAFLLLAWLGVIRTRGALAGHVVLELTCTTAGSVALGVVCGAALAIFHAKLPTVETLLVFFGVFLLLGAGERWLFEQSGLSYNFLLTALVIGGVFANIAVDPARLSAALRTAGAPILAGFFVIAGYGLHIGELMGFGWIGVCYVVCRLLGKVMGCRLGVRWAGEPEGDPTRLGSALLCQAAVVIGLSSFVERTWDSELAGRFSTIILGSVVIFELIGPLLVKHCVVSGGEVKAITLLSHAGARTEGASIVRLTAQSLLRLFGWPSRVANDDPAGASVEQVMRSNVQLIPASATFDEVLHLIERSTYSHFPVVTEAGEYVGVIHFSDIRDMIYDPSLRDLVTAVDLADPAAAVVPIDMGLTELLGKFTSENVGLLTVVESRDSRRIVGVVEQRDLLKALHLSQKAVSNATE